MITKKASQVTAAGKKGSSIIAAAAPAPIAPIRQAKVKKPKQLSIVAEDNVVKKTGPKPKDRALVKARPFLVLSNEAEYIAFHEGWENSGLSSRSQYIHSLVARSASKK